MSGDENSFAKDVVLVTAIAAAAGASIIGLQAIHTFTTEVTSSSSSPPATWQINNLPYGQTVQIIAAPGSDLRRPCVVDNNLDPVGKRDPHDPNVWLTTKSDLEGPTVVFSGVDSANNRTSTDAMTLVWQSRGSRWNTYDDNLAPLSDTLQKFISNNDAAEAVALEIGC